MLSGRGLCDELITRPEESYRLCCVVVCDLETSRIGAYKQFRSDHTVAKIDFRRVRLSVRLRAFRSTRKNTVPIGRIEDFYENLRFAIV